MLDTVTKQRDRLRVRAEELERNSSDLLQRIEKYLEEIEQVRGENFDLFEAVQRMRSTQGELGGSSQAPRDSVAISIPDTTMRKYENAYRQQRERDGLASRREQHRRVGSMNRAERFTYRAGEKLLQHNILRLAFFTYFCLFHVLVYATLISRSFHSLETL